MPSARLVQMGRGVPVERNLSAAIFRMTHVLKDNGWCQLAPLWLMFSAKLVVPNAPLVTLFLSHAFKDLVPLVQEVILSATPAPNALKASIFFRPETQFSSACQM